MFQLKLHFISNVTNLANSHYFVLKPFAQNVTSCTKTIKLLRMEIKIIDDMPNQDVTLGIIFILIKVETVVIVTICDSFSS